MHDCRECLKRHRERPQILRAYTYSSSHQISSPSFSSLLGNPADRAIYFTFLFFFLNWAKLYLDLKDEFSRFFSPNGRYLRKCCQSRPVFLIPRGMMPWQPILGKNDLRSAPRHFKTDCNITICISSFSASDPSTSCIQILWTLVQ